MLKRRVAFFDLVNALIVAGESTALQTPSAAVLNRFGYGSSGGIMPDVSVEICNRAYVPFFEQHVGLNANQSMDLMSTDQWMWLCALAYGQLGSEKFI
jgi:hypothetical protein